MTAYTLRSLKLPDSAQGKLYLSSMPGYLSFDFATDSMIIGEAGIGTVICLVSNFELASYSPEYAGLFSAGQLDVQTIQFSIPDYGVPTESEALLDLVREVAGRIDAGERMLVHCAAGLGRTGLFATLVLMALGLSIEEARSMVHEAGSGSENGLQRQLERWAAEELQKVG